MLAYAAARPVLVDRRPHPNAMLLIIGAHVAVIAAVMSAKIEIQRHRPPPPTILISVPVPHDPPPHLLTQKSEAHPNSQSVLDHTRRIIDTPPSDNQPQVVAGPTSIDPGPVAVANTDGTKEIVEPILRPAAPTGARLLTPGSELRPPYPPSKLLNDEEAVLTLRLRIDADGRVTSVEPVGHADLVFLEAARKYLMAHWRYAPATDGGHAVASTTVVTLHFELNG